MKNADTLIIDYGASHTLIGLFNRTTNDFQYLHIDKLVQNGLLNSVLYLHPNLDIDCAPENVLYTFSEIKSDFINNHAPYELNLILKTISNVPDKEFCETVFAEDKSLYASFITKNNQFYDAALINELKYKLVDNEYQLTLNLKISLETLLQAFFLQIKRLVFMATETEINSIVYALPVATPIERKNAFEKVLDTVGYRTEFTLSEPEASIMAYQNEILKEDNEFYLVIDAGAFTVDAALVYIQNQHFIVSAYRGGIDNGGNLIDNELIALWYKKYQGLPSDLNEAILETKIFLNNEKNTSDFNYQEQNGNSYSPLLPTSGKLLVPSLNEKQYLKTNATYATSIYEYNNLTSNFMIKYHELVLDFIGIKYKGVILTGGSNLNRVILDYWERKSKKTGLVIYHKYIFNAVVLGLKNAFIRFNAKQWNMQYVTPIDIMATVGKKDYLLINAGEQLPVNNKTFIFKIKNEDKLNLYLGLGTNELIEYQQMTKQKAITNISIPLLKTDLDLQELSKHLKETPLEIKVNVSLTPTFEIMLNLQTKTAKFTETIITGYQIDKFNQIYLQLAQKAINDFKMNKQLSTTKRVNEILNKFKTYANELRRYELELLSVDWDKIKKTFPNKSQELHEYEKSYQELFDSLNIWNQTYNSLIDKINEKLKKSDLNLDYSINKDFDITSQINTLNEIISLCETYETEPNGTYLYQNLTTNIYIFLYYYDNVLINYLALSDNISTK